MRRTLPAIGLCLILWPALLRAQDEPVVSAEPIVFLVLFDRNNAELSTAAKAVVDEAVREYRIRKQSASEPFMIWITGHYDTSSTSDHAEALSRKMAENVHDYLVSAGLPTEALNVSWSGDRQPALPTSDGVSEPANRRVEINFTYPPQ